MYKTVRLDLKAKFDLDDPYWVEMIPVAWLPKRISSQIAQYWNESITPERQEEMKKLQEDPSNPEAISSMFESADSDFRLFCRVLSHTVVDWNLIDYDGNKIDTPKQLIKSSGEEGMFERMEEIPLQILSYVFEAANSEDFKDIPLVSKRPQEPPSLALVPPQVIPPQELNLQEQHQS